MQAEAALSQLRALLAELGLELADAKTRLVQLDNDGERSFDFLGSHHQMVESFSKPGWHFLARWPSAAATQAARQRIRELSDRRLLRLPVEDVVANLNRFLTGWGGYFRRGNSTTQFHKLDRYAVERLGRFVGQRHGFKRPLAHGRWLVRQQGYLGLRPLFCVVKGATRGRPLAPTAARAQLRRLPVAAGVRRRFAPHPLRHAHAIEMAHEGVALKRQLGHTDLGVTSTYLQGIDNAEIINAVHSRRPPMMPASAMLRL